MNIIIKEILVVLVIIFLCVMVGNNYYQCEKLGGVLVGGKCVELKVIKELK